MILIAEMVLASQLKNSRQGKMCRISLVKSKIFWVNMLWKDEKKKEISRRDTVQ
jgi:hypothetical protein